MSWKLHLQKLGVSIEKYRTELRQRAATSEGNLPNLRKKKIIHSFYMCKISVFFTTPPTHIPFLNSTVIINFNPLEANYDLQMANPFSSALEGRGSLFR
jgi:hypothetical protein